MALDTNLTPEIVNSFNVYIDGVKAIGTAPEITLPQITSKPSTFPVLVSSAKSPHRISASLRASSRKLLSTSSTRLSSTCCPRSGRSI